MSDIADLRLIRKQELLQIVPLHYNSILRLMQRNEFPRPIRLSQNAVAWRESDVRAWMESRPTQPYKQAG